MNVDSGKRRCKNCGDSYQLKTNPFLPKGYRETLERHAKEIGAKKRQLICEKCGGEMLGK